MDHFPEVSKIEYEGPKSKNPLAFKYYNADKSIEGVTMRELLRFSVCYWHTFRATGTDPFGESNPIRCAGPPTATLFCMQKEGTGGATGLTVWIASSRRPWQTRPFGPVFE